jgi:outer membrane receptor for ferrienterochelin and colicins
MARGVACLFALALFCAPSFARADRAEQARFHDELARRYVEQARQTGQRRYLEMALREFLLEQRIAPNPRIVFNIALCFQQLGRDAQAFHYYDEYNSSDDEDQARRRTAGEAIRALRPRLALVNVMSVPSGARIYVDRRDLGVCGETPRVIAVEPGHHRVVLEIDGWRELAVEVDAVTGREVEARGTLEQIVGTLHIESSVEGSVRVWNAQDVVVARGEAPLHASLPQGDYQLELLAPGYRRWVRLAHVRADEHAYIVAEPEALPPPSGELTVTSNVVGAIVTLDGQPIGFTPLVLPDAAIGRHRVRVNAEGHSAWRGETDVAAGRRSWITVSLAPPEVTRSQVTWWAFSIAAANAIMGAGFGIFALERRAAFDDGRISSADDAAAVTADFCFVTAIGHAIAGLVLYFATEHGIPGESSAASSSEEDEE